MHFGTKSYLKSTRNHTAKHALSEPKFNLIFDSSITGFPKVINAIYHWNHVHHHKMLTSTYCQLPIHDLSNQLIKDKAWYKHSINTI